MIKVIIADDHPVVRAGIRAEIEEAEGMEVIGEASSGEEALRLVEEILPDVLVLDVVMPGLDGVELTRILSERFPDLGIVALSAYDENEFVFGVLSSGARGYVLKDEALDAIVEAIRAAYRGKPWLSDRVLEKVRRRAVEKVFLLTDRELEVLRLMAKGKSNKEIAKELYITESTVRFHVKNVLSKLGVRSRTEAVVEGMRRGLIRIEK
jgi:NarL family two-component system response regulator LiaR